MAESESQEQNYYKSLEMMEDLRKDMDELVDEMGKLAVRAVWMAYNCVAIHTDIDLLYAMQRLEDAFLMCKEQMERKGQEVLLESRGSYHHAASESTSISSEDEMMEITPK